MAVCEGSVVSYEYIIQWLLQELIGKERVTRMQQQSPGESSETCRKQSSAAYIAQVKTCSLGLVLDSSVGVTLDICLGKE